jgi:bifunctional enzyme CysN/CysC
MVAWMSEGAPLKMGAKYAIKHTTRWGKAMVRDVQYRLDVNTLHRDESSESLSLNEIGRVRLRSTTPFFFDEYRRNRETGSFVLVDESSNVTLGAGMITGEGT